MAAQSKQQNGQAADEAPAAPSLAKTQPPNLELIKQLLLRARGVQEFVHQADKEGFRLVDHSPTHSIYVKGECTLVMGVLASKGPDTIWFLSLIEHKGAPIVNLVDEGKLMF
jgi:hypothetical protein